MNDKQNIVNTILFDIINPRFYSNDQNRILYETLGLEDFLLKKIVSSKKKFRRGPIPNNEMNIDLRRKILSYIQINEPISFSVPFGAYKGWQTNSAGEPDWAEVFNLNYFYLYASEIAEYYEPGVNITYTYQDRILPVISNLSKNACKIYMQKFNQLTDLFSSFNPRITFNSLSIDSLYPNLDEYYQEFLENVFENMIEVVDSLYSNSSDSLPYRKYIDLFMNNEINEANKLVQSRPSSVFAKLQSGMNNYNFRGYDAKSSCINENTKTKIIRSVISALMIDAIDSLKLRRKFNKYSNNIQIVFDKTPNFSLFLGSCRESVKHFWTGTGGMIYKENKNVFKPIILSQKEWVSIQQGEKIKLNGETSDSKYFVEQIPVNTKLSLISENYNNINIIFK